MLTFLQMMHRCSDQEAIERSKYDDRWKCALDLEPDETLCSKGTLQNFRAHLHLDGGAEKKFLKRTLIAARKSGLLPQGGKLRSVLDTTPLLGRGAVKDTYNLIADGIVKLCRALCSVVGEKLEVLARRLDLSRYFEASSLKGAAEIDWSNAQERRVFLNGLVSDAERLSVEAQVKEASSEKQRAVICEAEELLRKLIVQDTGPTRTEACA
ncbi:MAG: transposase [Armatimonadetes bacterium]|nr:transposase [Armatimonadota bacterium]